MLEALQLSALEQPLQALRRQANGRFARVCCDSRQVQPGDLFVALRGPNFDGHAYLGEAQARGAAAALVEQLQPELALAQLQVADSCQALGRLAALNRDAFNGPLVAITGSSGKTTLKEMLASILRAHYADEAAVLATRGNLNNALGVPQTLLELAAQHRAAVIELGANHLGEIAYTVALARPQVAVISNAGLAHVGEFGGPDNIVKAKGEILDGLAAEGTAVLNRDDPAFAIWQARAGARSVLSFAVQASEADLRATQLWRDARGCVGFALAGVAGQARIQLNLLGEHNVANALAALAAGHALGVPLAAMVAGLQQLQPVQGRCQARLASNGLRIIDDSYNANPLSMCAAADLLAGFSGRRLLVLGDMGELGDWAEQGHRDVGAHAAGTVDGLYAVGPLMAHAVAAFGPAGRHFTDKAGLIEALRHESAGTTILVKGSRSAAMETIVDALLADTPGEID